MNTLLLCDYYKVEHHRMYNPGCTLIYSNLTPRKSRISGINSVVVFGIQHFVKKYLIEHFNKNFFNKPLKEVLEEYGFAVNTETTHIEALHKLGYLPIEVKALEEGSLCPIGVPVLTIKNTHPDFFWVTNYLETLLSTCLWQAITSATIAYEYKKLLTKYALETTGDAGFVLYQGHDFSMRGMSSVESSIYSGMAHLTSFLGTDVIPAIYELKEYYGAEIPAGGSVPATEHSIMCLGQKESEIETFKRLLTLYPTGILSVVSDTWDLWKVLTEYLPAIKSEVLARDGKLVIRPDSGDPVDIICGHLKGNEEESYQEYKDKICKMREERGIVLSMDKIAPEKGVIELLWDIFGGTYVTGNDGKQYKQLDSHVGAIYGDSITLDRAKQICERLKSKGFASTNVVLGIGSYTYQYNTRDTFGFAMKATYGEVNGTGREIFKDPVTDDGTKRSKKGLLCVVDNSDLIDVPYKISVIDQCTWEEEQAGLLETVFKDGKLVKTTTLEEIRNRLK